MSYVLIGIVVVLVIGVGWWISTSNYLKTLVIKVEESDSGIDVALIKRFDTLTKLLDVTKEYAKHEKETLSMIVSLRKGMSIEEKQNATRIMDEVQGRMNILVENYPDLKASTNFLELQKSIKDIEEHLQAARRLFNSNISIYNQSIVVFPSSIVANSLNLAKKVFIEAEETKKQDVSMKF